MIQVRGLHVAYRWGQEPVLRGVTAVFDGKCLVLGPNGSGKSTLFRAICGLTNIASGEILIDGRRIDEIYATPHLISTNFREVYGLVWVNAYDTVKLYMNLMDGEEPEEVYRMIEELGVSRSLLKKRKLHELSAGELKVLCTAIALSSKAKHVLLDEPFEQLDPAKKGRLIKFLNDYEGVIILNTHETWLLRSLTDWKTYFMFEGRLYGPVSVNDLLKARVVVSDKPEALLKFKVSGKTVSIVKGVGTPLTSIESLDRIYELA